MGVEHKRRGIHTENKKCSHAHLFPKTTLGQFLQHADHKRLKTCPVCLYFSLQAAAVKQTSLLGGAGIILKCLQVEKVTGCEHLLSV